MSAVILKYAIALGILAVVSYTFFRGQGWWWKLPKKTRVIVGAIVTLGIVLAGFMYKAQEGAFDDITTRTVPRAVPGDGGSAAAAPAR